MKKTLFTFFLLFISINAIEPPAERAQGLFFSIGVGPRFPVGSFSNSSDLGYGLNLELAYTDNKFIPIFLFAKAGFEQYPGSQNFYQATDYSNLSTYAFPLSTGVRYYFPPLVENVLLFIPLVEASVNFNYYQKLHQFKESANRSNYNEESTKLGFSAGVGFSTFLLELLTSYNYSQNNESVSLDLKIRLPLYIIY